jgi:hypothetical protein
LLQDIHHEETIMSKADIPPVPPAARSHKGPGDASGGKDAADTLRQGGAPQGNLAEQDRQGNIKQNTTHQGYQQDR